MTPAHSNKRVTPRQHVIVIGGGVGGLAAAIRLGAAGVRVTLLEKNARVGGKLNQTRLPHPGRDGQSFTFDTGPSLLTLPWVFEDLFRAGGSDLRNELDLVSLDPVSRFVWPDGGTLELRRDRDETLDSVRTLAPGDVDGFRRFLDKGKAVWDLAGELFLTKSPEQIMAEKRSPRDGLGMLALPFKIGAFKTYARLVDRYVKSERLRAVLYQYATYSGASPWKAPATLCVIPHAEMHYGGWYVNGGMYQLAESLRSLAERSGVDIRTDAAVEQITVRDGRATGVRLADGTALDADSVIANSDVISTYRGLLDPADRPAWQDAKLDKLDPGGSGMVLLLGVDGEYPQLSHHTKFMPDGYAARGGDLRSMFDGFTLPDEPCVYVCCTSRTDPSQAPAGCENLFVLVSAPPRWKGGRDIDWTAEAPPYRDRVIRQLETTFGLTDLSSRIVAEDRWTPADLESRYAANAGSIYGVGSNSRLQAFLRPPNRDKTIRNLFFAGGATHPGGGLPLVALSGKIASELVLADMGKMGRAGLEPATSSL